MADTPGASSEQGLRLLLALRAHGTAYTELGRLLGRTMGLHTTDATALMEILDAQDRGSPLTQVELGRRIGLTPGATSSLLNRLEDAGHVSRARDRTDRRVVTLHATSDVDDRIDRFFDPILVRVDEIMKSYSPETLAEFERFIGDFVTMLTGHIGEASRRDRA